ncbi:MAG: N-acetylmuramoyl-L-alanine amidase [Chitinophagaceae bacterium]|nr:N-acetylmuramoyl-L-alanine amidase [Chitinophagaceae bacterium]
MLLKKSVLFLFFLSQLLIGWSQPAEIIQQYIDQYKDLAIAEMKRTGVPASIKLAQGIHETMAGQSELVQKSNNHFGIKCKTGWNGPSVRHTDDARNECFRKYATASESYRDHSNFLKSSPRYASLFELDPTDYEAWAKGLKSAGYATNPVYSQTLVRLIEEYDLQQYSMQALGYETEEEDSTEIPVVPQKNPTPVNNESTMPAASTDDSAISLTKEEEKKVEKTANVKEVVETSTPAKSSRQYPSGVFKEEGVKAVYITAGTPFLVIAEQYKVPLAKLFEWNNLIPSTEARISQVIYLERPGSFKLRLPSLRSRQ